jgi:arylformamidase
MSAPTPPSSPPSLPRVDYESEYDNRARVPEHPAVIAEWLADARAFREVASCELGVPYGPSPRQFYDLFRPADMRATALALFVHGGYWRSLDPGHFSHMARGLNARGVAVAVVGYDLCPQVGIADIIGQTRYVAAALHRRFGLPLVAVGHSAGGHLAACLVATDWRAVAEDVPPQLVRAGYGISGLYNLKPLTEVSVNADLRLGFEEAEALSPFFWAAPAGVSFDAVVGALESGEYLRQSRRLVDAWDLGGTVTRYGELDGRNHFTAVADLTDPDSAMVARIADLCGA